MKATYRSADGRMTFEMEASSAKALFAKVALLQEIFESDTHCGCCQSSNLRFSHRITGDDFHYYELRCGSCGAQMDFGQTKKGEQLFAKRKDENGNALGENGWYVWRSERTGEQRNDRQEAPRPQAGQRPAPAPARRYEVEPARTVEVDMSDVPF